MIKPEPVAEFDFEAEHFVLLPAAGHLGVIEERCGGTHSTTTLHFGLPCPVCKAVV